MEARDIATIFLSITVKNLMQKNYTSLGTRFIDLFKSFATRTIQENQINHKCPLEESKYMRKKEACLILHLTRTLGAME
ncbi:UNVERIFIED_CONTAM: hypothetical protein NCL1_44509 [Trichonephila clavipes]